MKQHAWVELADAGMLVRLDWRDFDGDDCYGQFSILVRAGSPDRLFDMGPCSASCVARVTRFLRDPAATEAGGGFRNPDICAFSLQRTATGFRVVVERDGGRDEFELTQPAVKEG